MSRSSDLYLPRGTSFARGVIARALAPSPADALNLSANRWGHDSAAFVATKAAVGASDQDRDLIRAGESAQEFIELVRLQTALDRLPALRRVPRNVPTSTVTTGARAYWRGQGKAAKVSRQFLSRETMTALSVGALVVFDNALLEDSSPEAEALILRDLVAAVANAVDASFFDPSNSGVTDVEPASITNAAATVASTGDLVADLQAAFAQFAGQWSTASFVCHPKLAVDIGLLYGSRGIAVDCGARGGTLAGLPLLTTEGLEADSSGTGPLVLIDGGSVSVCDEGPDIRRSNITTLELDDAPAQDSLAPTGPTGAFVSMFQIDSTAVLAGRRINWRLARAGACVTITDCAYPAAS